MSHHSRTNAVKGKKTMRVRRLAIAVGVAGAIAVARVWAQAPAYTFATLSSSPLPQLDGLAWSRGSLFVAADTVVTRLAPSGAVIFTTSMIDRVRAVTADAEGRFGY